METNNRNNPENEPRTPEEILRTTATEFNALYKKARDALRQDRDTATFQLRLRDRARLLIFLPLKLQRAIEGGEPFPEKAMDKIRAFAADASEMLATDNNMFGLGTLLTYQGSKFGDPNDLERLIIKLYPPKEPHTGSEK
jgi:hypothetical protein